VVEDESVADDLHQVEGDADGRVAQDIDLLRADGDGAAWTRDVLGSMF
jgi:hypothetical protein